MHPNKRHLKKRLQPANPVPGQDFLVNNGTEAYVYLTAKIYNSQGEVKATDVTPPYPDVPINGVEILGMSPGEVENIAIYLATNRTDITSYKVILQAISAVPIP